MKRAILIIGVMLLMTKWTVVAGVCVILATVGVLIRVYLKQMEEILLEEADERAEQMADAKFREMVENTEYKVSFRQYVGLGKGFDE